MTPVILNDLMYDRGRGPELRSCRITVYDLVPYLLAPDYRDETVLEAWPAVSYEELVALKRYVADHREAVMAKHWQIEERIQREIAAQQTPEFLARFRLPERRLSDYPAWVREREQEAASGGPPLPPPGPERVKEFLAWRDASRPVPTGGSA